MNFLSKINFYLKKPKVVIITGNGRQTAKEAILQVLKKHFRVEKEVLIFETDLSNEEELKFLVNKSSLPVLVVTHIGDIPPDKDFFAGERDEKIQKFAKTIPAQGFLVLNFDDETVREIGDITNLKTFTFGLQEGAEFRATDLKLNGGTNFKINYKGSIVPIWLESLFGKEQIYAALAAAGVGVIFNLNLVEISQALKDYQGLPGKMKLIKGRNHSWILDDSESATIFTMAEAIDILGKIEIPERKIYPERSRRIAVLGDIIGVGKYTIEAHEAIGERVSRAANLLFTFGARAKFIGEGARNKGMNIDSIFQFDTLEDGKICLQDEIKEGDIILVDGSKELKMGKIVEGIEAK